MQKGTEIPQIKEIKPKKRNIFDYLIAEEGVDAQVWKVVEEAGELQTALAKHARGECGIKRVAEELTDLKITIEKIEYMMDEGLLKELEDQEYRELEEECGLDLGATE